MTNSEYLEKWETPDSYFGYNPVGDYIIYTKTGNSTILEEVNYQAILDILGDEVYEFSAKHFAVGYISYIMLKPDSPKVAEAEELVCALADYPILDPTAYSEAQYLAITDYYFNLRIRERAELAKECGDNVSLFSLRHSIPENSYYSLSDSFY